jgi:hypothetical protein
MATLEVSVRVVNGVRGVFGLRRALEGSETFAPKCCVGVGNTWARQASELTR